MKFCELPVVNWFDPHCDTGGTDVLVEAPAAIDIGPATPEPGAAVLLVLAIVLILIFAPKSNTDDRVD